MFPNNFFCALIKPELKEYPDLKHKIDFDDVNLAKELINGTRPRDSEIMWKYYAEGKTLAKLGVEYSVSGSRIRQIIQRNLVRIRKHLAFVNKGCLPDDLVCYAAYSAHPARRNSEKNTVTRETFFYRVKDVGSLLSRWEVRLRVKEIKTVGDLLELDDEKLCWIPGIGKVGKEKVFEAQRILKDKYGL